MRIRNWKSWITVSFVLICAIVAFGQEKPVSSVDTGIQYYRTGRYKECLEVLKNVIQTSISDNELFLAHLYSSYTYFSMPVQELENAQAQAEKAITINPNYIPREDEFVTDFIDFYKKAKEQLTGIAFFDVDPNPAAIILNNLPLGTSPFKKELLAKVYLLRVVKWGYTPYETEIEVKKTEMINFNIPLNDEKNWKTFLRSSVIFALLTVLIGSI